MKSSKFRPHKDKLTPKMIENIFREEFWRIVEKLYDRVQHVDVLSLVLLDLTSLLRDFFKDVRNANQK